MILSIHDSVFHLHYQLFNVILSLNSTLYFSKYLHISHLMFTILCKEGSTGSIQCFFFFWSFCLFIATPEAYGGSQARGPIRLQPPAHTTATKMQDPSHVRDLHHSSQQHRILNPPSEARDQTHNLMVPSRMR